MWMTSQILKRGSCKRIREIASVETGMIIQQVNLTIMWEIQRCSNFDFVTPFLKSSSKNLDGNADADVN